MADPKLWSAIQRLAAMTDMVMTQGVDDAPTPAPGGIPVPIEAAPVLSEADKIALKKSFLEDFLNKHRTDMQKIELIAPIIQKLCSDGSGINVNIDKLLNDLKQKVEDARSSLEHRIRSLEEELAELEPTT